MPWTNIISSRAKVQKFHAAKVFFSAAVTCFFNSWWLLNCSDVHNIMHPDISDSLLCRELVFVSVDKQATMLFLTIHPAWPTAANSWYLYAEFSSYFSIQHSFESGMSPPLVSFNIKLDARFTCLFSSFLYLDIQVCCAVNIVCGGNKKLTNRNKQMYSCNFVPYA